MRLLICAGGTGGGVYPALAILKALGSDAADVLWVGGEGGMEANLVKRTGVPYTTIPAAGVHGVGLRNLPGNIWQLWRGTLAARRLLNQFRPDVLLFTGGYIAAPMAVAGHHIPSLLYVPDIEPGLAIKFLARFASCIGLTSDSSRQFFSNKNHCTVTGYPTRPDLKRIDKQSARTEFNLQPDLPVLLVFGGSKGARSINRALFAILEPLLKTTQVLHISGERDWQEVEKAKIELSSTAASHYHAYAYLHEEMGAALACADLVVSRAGASTLGEFPLYGLPAILVPYPHAWRYQRVNATYLADHNAAMIIEDNQLGDQLLPAIKDLLQQPEKLSAMSQAMFSLAHPQAASKLAAIIRAISNQDVHLTGAIQ